MIMIFRIHFQKNWMISNLQFNPNIKLMIGIEPNKNVSLVNHFKFIS